MNSIHAKKLKWPIISLVLISVILLSLGCSSEKKAEATEEDISQVKVEQVKNETEQTVEVKISEEKEQPEEKIKTQEEPLPPVDCSNPAPAFSLEDTDGKMVSLEDYKGKIIILDFWTTWCRPCRMEIPFFIEFQNEYADDGLEVIGISLDNQRTAVKGFIKSMKINYTILYGNREVAMDYGNVTSIPTTFIIDRSGCITKKLVGYHSKQQFEELISDLLEDNT